MKRDRTQYSKDYYQKHKERIIQRTTNWQQTHPELKREIDKRFRQNHKEGRNEAQRERRKQNPEKFNEYMRNWSKLNPEKIIAYQKKYRFNLRMKIFKLLGNKCSNPNCTVPNGERDWRALQIDHVNGGGRRETKKFKTPIGYYVFVLKQIKAGSKNYQLLCANCNWKKRYDNNEIYEKARFLPC